MIADSYNSERLSGGVASWLSGMIRIMDDRLTEIWLIGMILRG